MRKVIRAIIHAIGTKEGKHYDIDDVRKWHTMPKDNYKFNYYTGTTYLGKLYKNRSLLPANVRERHGRGFNDVGYHFLILLDGTFEIGRPIEKPGAHCTGYNLDSIGVAYVGGLDDKGKAKDTRTQEQKDGLHKLLSYLVQQYPDITEIKGHRDYSPDLDGDGTIERHEWIKMCPCHSCDEYQYLLK